MGWAANGCEEGCPSLGREGDSLRSPACWLEGRDRTCGGRRELAGHGLSGRAPPLPLACSIILTHCVMPL